MSCVDLYDSAYKIETIGKIKISVNNAAVKHDHYLYIPFSCFKSEADLKEFEKIMSCVKNLK